ncbi:MAG: hypothetical protein LUD01_05100 [Clostridiales bacterium]|nr:hypothetical protein [Clostridiales bacterium]
MRRLSKRGKKILAMVPALAVIAGLIPNMALPEGWHVLAWARNVSAQKIVSVSYVDTTAPVIGTIFETSYWKTGDDKLLDLEVSDDDSGVSAVSVYRETDTDIYAECDDNYANITSGSAAGEYTLTVKKEGTYKIKAVDEAGNEAYSDAFTVKQDSAAPEITQSSVVNDADMTAKDTASDTYYFYSALTAAYVIGDEVGSDETCKSEIFVSVSGDSYETAYALDDLSSVFTASGSGIELAYENGTLTARIVFSGTYTFTVKDEAGNSSTANITAAQSSAAPTADVELDGTTVTYEDVSWYAKDQTPGVALEIRDDVGIASISYSLAGTSEKNEKKDYAAGGVYTNATTSYSGTLDALLTDAVAALTDGSYELSVTVTNIVGKTDTESVSFKVDQTVPESAVYVAYTSDPSGDYYDSGITTALSRIFTSSVGKVFGKNTIGFTLYVRDGGSIAMQSGIDIDALKEAVSIDSDAADKVTLNIADKVSAVGCTIGSGSAAVTATYTVVRGTLTSADSATLNTLKISEIRDNVGNAITEIDSAEIESGDIILDDVAPTVDVSYAETTYLNNGVYYYSERKVAEPTVTLTYGEKFFESYTDDDGIVEPVIKVFAGDADATADATIEAGTYDKESCTISYTVTLPYVSGEEKEYVVYTSYTDGSGNSLALAGETTELMECADYDFCTATLVLDDIAPAVSVAYPENSSVSENTYNDGGNRYYFYSRGSSSAAEYEEIVLTYTETYYDVYLSGGQPVKPEIVVTRNGVTKACDVVWNNPGDGKITAAVQLPYVEDKECEYVIETGYKDAAQNPLTTADHTDKLAGTSSGYESMIIVLDDAAPVLTAYSIKETSTATIDGAGVYSNRSGDDVTIIWSVDDNDTYWDASALTFKIYNKTTGKVSVSVTGDEIEKWSTKGRTHTAAYTFDGDEAPANYYVAISYEDRAGNAMVAEDSVVLKSTDTAGVYSGKEKAQFILDHTAPVVEISYNDAYQLVDGDGVTADGVTKPTTGYTAYYGKAQGKIQMAVTITEDYAVESMANRIDTAGTATAAPFTIKVNGKVYTDIDWEDKQGITYTANLVLDADDGDDNYVISVFYADAAGNNMMAGETVEGSDAAYSSGTYTSETLVLDTAAPVITGIYNSTVMSTKNSRDYFDTTSAKLELTVDDKNIRDKELIEAMSGDKAYLVGSAGSNIFSSTKAGAYINGLIAATMHTGKTVYTIPLSTEANYNLLITGYEDLAGNKALIDSGYNPYVCVDANDPIDVSFTYSVSSLADYWSVNYRTPGYIFSNTKLTITASAADEAAGIQSFTFYVTDENGKVTTIVRNDAAPAESKSASITIPVSNSNFKGTVRVVAADWSDNETEKTEGQIVESSGMFVSAGSAVITTLTSPSRTVDGVDYYNTDVTFKLTLEETYSGLRSYEYKAGSQIFSSCDYAEAAGSDLEAVKTKSITYTYSKNLTISSAANNENDVSVDASYVSNTGYTGSVQQKYNIDITKPTIEVTWDNNNASNETYYNAARTATVVITERNFDPDDVVFNITNTDETMPAISSWTTTGSGDSTKHIARVTFGADGDYTFAVAFQDLAGNKADYTTVDVFTVDQTKPTYTVAYDNNSSQNVYYYDENRAATIDVYEHNFDPAAVTITVTKDGAAFTPVISGWSTNGDHNVATVSFNTDGEYTFTLSGTDMAANPMNDYTEDHFVVDTTEPVIEIFDIENYSANNSVVAPGVRYSDTNYDPNAIVVELDGYDNGVTTIDGLAPSVSGDSVEVKMDDFAYEQSVDDMYTLTATVYDLAGNSAEASVVFSVNRFGSVYTFDTATDGLVGEDGKYYTDEEQDIVVIETNVDTLEERSIAKSTNGSLTTLTEDDDYSVKSSGNDMSWKQHTYTVDRENFADEGEYVLTFTSVDRATNSNRNEKKVAFVVDKTAPTVTVAGVADGGQYRQDSMDISISASDNVRIDSVTVTNDGESTTYDYEIVTSGAFSYTMNSKNSRQTLVVVAKDAAGNESTCMSLVDENGNITEMSAVSYLLTTSLWIQFISNKVLVTVAAAALIAILALFRWFLIEKKRRKGKEEGQAKV